jgi:hypothetical protein
VLRGKLCGFYVGGIERSNRGEFDHMTDDELRQWIAEEAQAMRIPISAERKYPVD